MGIVPRPNVDEKWAYTEDSIAPLKVLPCSRGKVLDVNEDRATKAEICGKIKQPSRDIHKIQYDDLKMKVRIGSPFLHQSKKIKIRREPNVCWERL